MFRPPSSSPNLYAIAIGPIAVLHLASPTIAGALTAAIGAVYTLRELMARRKP